VYLYFAEAYKSYAFARCTLGGSGILLDHHHSHYQQASSLWSPVSPVFRPYQSIRLAEGMREMRIREQGITVGTTMHSNGGESVHHGATVPDVEESSRMGDIPRRPREPTSYSNRSGETQPRTPRLIIS